MNHMGISIQSSIIHLEFSQNLSESPDPSFEAHCATEGGTQRKQEANAGTGFLQPIGTGWSRALMGRGLPGRCSHGLSWSLCIASTSAAKEQGSWYDTDRFFTDTLLWKLGQTSGERLGRDMRLNQLQRHLTPWKDVSLRNSEVNTAKETLF